jgi:hypothetical protein
LSRWPALSDSATNLSIDLQAKICLPVLLLITQRYRQSALYLSRKEREANCSGDDLVQERWQVVGPGHPGRVSRKPWRRRNGEPYRDLDPTSARLPDDFLQSR